MPREQNTFTFNVSTSDKSNMELLRAIRADCRKNGQSFTWVCLKALRDYYENK